MPTNKLASIRYKVLDNCFRNNGRKYFMADLIEACNKAIYEFTGNKNGVKKRQIFNDIKFMESEVGYAIQLNKIKDCRKTYYRYEDPNYSIFNNPLNETDIKQFKSALKTLNQFKGLPQFNWMNELIQKLEKNITHSEAENNIIQFENNEYLEGTEFISDLHNAISYKKIINVKYQSFKNPDSSNFKLHPYFLKQYNNRWFLFAWNPKYESITNLALDRIIEVKELKDSYKEIKVDIDDYFEDLIGVTIPQNEQPKKINIQVDNDLYNYIKTKPIHGSQRKIKKTRKHTTIEIEVFINYELKAKLFSYMDKIKIVKPKSLALEMKKIANKIIKNYN